MDSIQTMASSSSSTMPSSEGTSCFSSQTETEMEFAKARHWSQLDYPTTGSEFSAETNFKDFALLKEDPERGRFFRDFEALEVGEKISEGAQADIYEARKTCDGPFDLVVKVMKGDAPLKTFQAQWPIGMLSARLKYKQLFDLPLITILGITVLRDERLRGRFAFVMYRRWGDLRVLIDRRMKQERITPGPFSIDEAIHLMLSIAEDMEMLHNKHDIIHRDLKASNVLVWRGFGSVVAAPDEAERIGSLVADFECSVGVLGTRFWRAPEILEQLLDRVPSSEVCFTHASDVYSYGMICYEIVTGFIPFDNLGVTDARSQILQGQRPELPHGLPEFVRTMILGCWHSNPLERPSFSTICTTLKGWSIPINVVIDNKSERGGSIVKVEQWNNPQAWTLLEVMQILMDMDLSVLKASDSSSTKMITQYFEVVDCEGKKVVNDKSIENIIETLSLLEKTKCISESVETSTNGNNIVQMYVLDVVAERSASFFGAFSGLLVATNFRVYSTECWTCEGRLECVICMEGGRMDSLLLWELRHSMVHFSKFIGRLKINVNRVADQEISHLSSRLHNLKSMDLILPCHSSDVRVCQRKETKHFRATGQVLCVGKSEPLVHVSRTLADMNYKIIEASVKYLGSYKFLKGRAIKTKHIKIGSPCNEEMGNMERILDVAFEHGCPNVNVELSILGPSPELHGDLTSSLYESGLCITGGQFYFDYDEYCPSSDFSSPCGYLEIFVTESQ